MGYKFSKNTIDILGTEYSLYFKKEDEIEYLKECNGFCDRFLKKIFIKNQEDTDLIYNPKGYLLNYYNVILKHEIVHAFITEIGKANESLNEEEVANFLEVNLEKIYKAFEEAKVKETDNS